MSKNIAVQPDYKKRPNGSTQSFSNEWTHVAKDMGINLIQVNVYSTDSIAEIKKADAFMWRFTVTNKELQRARDIFPALAMATDIPTFPGPLVTHFMEDKIRQHTLLTAADYPTPRTWVFYDEPAAMSFLDTATFPMVIKLSAGCASNNVGLLKTRKDAEAIVRLLFSNGITHLWKAQTHYMKRFARNFVEGVQQAITNSVSGDHDARERGHILFQEFLPGNAFDTRVTIIGRYAYAFVRHNRDNDFRASGGGKLDYDSNLIDERCIHMAFDLAVNLNLPFIAIDFMFLDNQPVIVELNFSYGSYAVAACPGRWFLGDALCGDLRYEAGKTSPEITTFSEFIHRVFL